MKKKWDLRFLRLAREVSTFSKDPSTQTGAVIVDEEHNVLSVGYNGFPRDMKDDPALYLNREEKYSRIVHCEVNALLRVRRALYGSDILYTYPFMSCDRCVVQMLQAGFRLFVAPLPTPSQLERWAKSFERTTKYIEECGGTLIQYGVEELGW